MFSGAHGGGISKDSVKDVRKLIKTKFK